MVINSQRQTTSPITLAEKKFKVENLASNNYESVCMCARVCVKLAFEDIKCFDVYEMLEQRTMLLNADD